MRRVRKCSTKSISLWAKGEWLYPWGLLGMLPANPECRDVAAGEVSPGDSARQQLELDLCGYVPLIAPPWRLSHLARHSSSCIGSRRRIPIWRRRQKPIVGSLWYRTSWPSTCVVHSKSPFSSSVT